ncbi:MAG: aminopeptidase [Candidatus Thorarchaeota archaeon]
MINIFFEKLAKLVVNYSMKIKRRDRVFITGPTFAKELFQALYIEIIKSGGYPLLWPQIEGLDELKYKYATEEQLKYVDPIRKLILREFEGYIIIDADYNTRKLSLVDVEKIALAQGSLDQREMYDILGSRLGKEGFNYLLVPFPCNALAQEANMDLVSYFEFMRNALFLDKDDPVKEWSDLDQRQQLICDFLESVENLRIIGEDTDLKLSITGRNWVNCSGKINLPDGEVCTTPLERSANGYIRFTFPGIYQGKEIENLYLEFKDGVVVNATADKGQELLKEILKIENANKLGEFAVGTNYGITRFTKHMLFDEKLGGTIHLALGAGIQFSGSDLESAIHWDILKDMKIPGSKIFADDKVIYQDGQWLI